MQKREIDRTGLCHLPDHAVCTAASLARQHEMDGIEPGMTRFLPPATFLPHDSYTSTVEPSMATEQRYLGRVKTVNTTPPSLTIVPEDRTIRPDYDLVFGLSHIQLAEFLYSFGNGNMRVSYALRPGPAGELVVQDVQNAEAVEVKQEYSPSESAYGLGEVKIEKEKVGMLGL